MRTRGRFQWVGVVTAMMVTLAGCAERKFSDAAKEEAARNQPCDASANAMMALRIRADTADAKSLLSREGPRCYEQRLEEIRGIEGTNGPKAMDDYASLKSFVSSLRSYGVEFPAIDFDAKIGELKDGVDAEAAYAAAEAAMQAQSCPEAIQAYRRSLDLVANYRDAKHKVAECYYEMAASATENRLYRRASEHFRQADQFQPNYKDSRARAARIHLALGNYFLAQGYSRKAVEEFQATEAISPDFPGVRIQMESAKAKAIERIAVAGFNNPTGNNIEGMAVEEFIADSIIDKLQNRKSQFLEVYTRNQLESLLTQLRLGVKGIPDQTTVSDLEKLRGVKYLVIGRMTQVSQRQAGPERSRRATSIQVPVDAGVGEHDRNGRSIARQQHPGTRTQSVQYDEITWSARIVVAGSVNVLDVQTGKIVVARNFDKRESRAGRWAENLSMPEVEGHLSAEVQRLFRASRQVASPDAMAKSALDNLAEEFVSAILEKIDGVSSVPDPTVILAEFVESTAPIVTTLPRERERTASPAPTVEGAVRLPRVRVKGDAVNIRVDPSTQSRTLARAGKGNVFPVITRQKDWVRIQLRDGLEGWIPERLVEMLPE